MACRLTTPSNSLNQSWQIIMKSWSGIHLRGVSQEILNIPILNMFILYCSPVWWLKYLTRAIYIYIYIYIYICVCVCHLKIIVIEMVVQKGQSIHLYICVFLCEVLFVAIYHVNITQEDILIHTLDITGAPVQPPIPHLVCTSVLLRATGVNSSPPGQNRHSFADSIFRCIFVNRTFCILIKISLKIVPKDPIGNKPALV